MFLNDTLALELSDEKTLITHSEKSAMFLGYEISVRKSNATKRTAIGVTRVFNKKVQLMVSKDLVKNKLLQYKVLEIKIHNGKEQWKPRSRPYLVSKDDLEILMKYNSEIRGLVNYYSLAINCGRLAQFGHIMEYSMYKTFAHKYRTKVPIILKKYNRNGHFSVRYRLKSGESKDLTFFHDGFARKKEPMRYMFIDNVPNTHYFPANSLINRLKTEKCELCGATNKLAMRHVRKLNELKGESPWEKSMIARKRKTIALCGKCLKNLLKNE